MNVDSKDVTAKSDLKEQFDALIEKQKQLKEQFQFAGKVILKRAFKEFFDANPGVKCIVWTQYTPYFNDGDTCTFSVNETTFSNAEGSDIEDVTPWGEYEGENESVWVTSSMKESLKGSKYYENEHEKIKAAGLHINADDCEQLSHMLQCGEMDEIMENMFNDHSKVIATRSGFEVEEYSHD